MTGPIPIESLLIHAFCKPIRPAKATGGDSGDEERILSIMM